MRFATHLWTALVCVGTLASNGAGGAERLPTTVIILDCSRSMGEPFTAHGEALATDSRSRTTRLDVAKDVLVAALNDLSLDPAGRPVALWLFGHRLGWEPGKSDPDLMEQTAYLEQTLGFQVLTHLLPGDDVEIIRPAKPLEPRNLAEIEVRLSVVKPWGEDPLYQAMVRAIDNLGKSAVSGQHRLIVITDGGNQQGMCKYPTNKEQVLEAIERSAPVQVNMIVLGGNESISRQTAAEFNQLAGKTQGQISFVKNGSQLQSRLREAIQDASAKPAVQSVALPDNLQAAIALLKSGSAANARIVKGRVLFLDKTVENAKIVLEGDIGLKTYRTVSSANGSFEFPAVGAGRYLLRAEFVVKNRIRDAALPIVIEATGGEAITLDVQLQ